MSVLKLPFRNRLPSPEATAVHSALERYGDLLFDLCESVLQDPTTAQVAFRAVIQAIRSQGASQDFREHERSWILRLACQKLVSFAARHGRRLTSSEQIELDAAQTQESRLKRLESYLRRLSTEDQILLLLRDKYGLPYPEISAALGIPEGTLKLRRAQNIRALEEWIWDQRQ